MNSTKKTITWFIIITAPIACIMISLCLGRYPIPFSEVAKIFWCKLTLSPCTLPDIQQSVVWDIRFPRAVLGSMVGGSLAVSGAAFQGLFKNPLVSSGILGVSSGAGFGAALAILLFNTALMIYPMALFFGILAVCLSYMIGRIYKTSPVIMLVLGGVIVSSVFSALISFAKYVADPYEQLPTIVFWLMGSLASARVEDIAIAGIPMLLGVLGLLAVRWQINVLSMGDKEARTLGVNTRLIRGIIIVSATLATAGAVCISGVIGWIGLVIPHISRMLA